MKIYWEHSLPVSIYNVLHLDIFVNFLYLHILSDVLIQLCALCKNTQKEYKLKRILYNDIVYN